MSTSDEQPADDTPSDSAGPWSRADLDALLGRFDGALGDRAALLRTPLPARVALSRAGLDDTLRDLITRLEPRVGDGLFAHQAEVLARVAGGGAENLLLTSSTGTGKSLCFWAFVFRHLLADETATALVCFPTQALLWSQARRLEAISSGTMQTDPDQPAFGGSVLVDSARVDWTVWKGTGQGAAADLDMREHSQSIAFERARLRLATIDKVHASMFGEVDFVARLACVVLDEAHTYEGAFGANVHYLLKRLWVARAAMALPRPWLFLSSATLEDPVGFVRRLLSLPTSAPLHHVADRHLPTATTVGLDEARAALLDPPMDALLRVAFIAQSALAHSGFDATVAAAADWGRQRNVVYFVNSKLEGRLLASRLRATPEAARRRVLLYDADLAPQQRRRIERDMTAGKLRDCTLLATNALELGVDVEGLDVCLIPRLPPSRRSLAQRIGRIGRRVGRPGLAVLGATPDPAGLALLADPGDYLGHDQIEPSPLPLHLEHIRLRHQFLLNKDRVKERYSAQRPGRYSIAVRREFGADMNSTSMRTRLGELCGGLTSAVLLGGLRSSTSRAKVPLIAMAGFEAGEPRPQMRDGRRVDVAWIEDANVFRDAHPEGVFLDHRGHRWRVRAYGGPGGQVSAIYVESCPEPVYTVGEWRDEYTLLVPSAEPPGSPASSGIRTFGIYRFERRWTGYHEYRPPPARVRWVPLGEIVPRFHSARAAGEDLPFLRPLQFSTQGFTWELPDLPATADEDAVVDELLSRTLLQRLEGTREDLLVTVNLRTRKWACFDCVPGGNGLAHTALARNDIGHAIETCRTAIAAFAGHAPQDFSAWIEALINRPVSATAERIEALLGSIAAAWAGPTGGVGR